MNENQGMKKQGSSNKRMMIVSFLITTIGALILIVTLLTPFSSAIDENKKYLQEYPDLMFMEEINMTNAEAEELSLFEYGRLYAEAIEMDVKKDDAYAYLIFILIYASFVVLTFLFSVFKRPIAIMIFNALSLGSMKFLLFVFDRTGVLPNSSYDVGISKLICYVAVTIVFFGAVLMFISKVKAKRKQSKSAE